MKSCSCLLSLMKLVLKSCNMNYATMNYSMEAEYCDKCGMPVIHVCMHVSVCMLISRITRPNLSECYMTVSYTHLTLPTNREV